MRTANEYESSHSSEAAADTSGSIVGHIWASIASTVVLLIICCGAYPVLIWGVGNVLFPWRANGSLVTKVGAPTTKDEEAVGSAILGQNFSAPQYFHPRPSAAGAAGYDAASSSGSNLGPLSDKLLNGLLNVDDKGVKTLAYDGVRLRTLHYALDNGIKFDASLPLDAFKDKDGNLDDVKLVDAFPHTGDPADKKPLVLTNFSTPIPGDAVTASGSGLDPHITPRNAELQTARVAKARGITVEQVRTLIEQSTDKPDLGILGEAGVNVLRLNLALDRKFPIGK